MSIIIAPDYSSSDPPPAPSITGNRTYTRANFLHHARVANPGSYR
jgi:hypothetical protein